MKVILKMDVADVGARGESVEVAAGFARNFLIPRRLAVPATRGNLRILEEEGKLVDVRGRKEQREAEKVRDFLGGIELFTTLKIGREGEAFGAVTSKDIAILLRQSGLEVDRRRIVLESPIKRLGMFEIPLHIHADVDTKVKLYIDRAGGSREGAIAEEAVWGEERKAVEEAERAETEARAQREKEAEAAAKLAIEKAAARKAREEEAARAREEKIKAAAAAETEPEPGEKPAEQPDEKAERSPE
jgi:large subunit ribosomal protein L9